MWSAFRHMGKFWKACRNKKMVKTIFHSNIIGSSYSGLEVLCLSKADSSRVDRTTMIIARRVLGKQINFVSNQHARSLQYAAGEDVETSCWKSLPNSEVRRQLLLLPHSTAMMLRRLQFYQRLILQPKAHTHTVCCTFVSQV